MAFYRTGTISMNNGSTNVVGLNTDFINNIAVGECLQAPSGLLYEIANIVSAVELTLGSPYLGVSISMSPYVIIPTQSFIHDLAKQVVTLVNGYADTRDNAGVGRFNDGTLAKPGLRFKSSEHLGIRRVSGDTFALVSSGVDQLIVSSQGVSIPNMVGASNNITGNLVGDITSVGNVTTLPDAVVLDSHLVGYVPTLGTITAADTILQAIEKLSGNFALLSSGSGSGTGTGTGTGALSAFYGSFPGTTANLTGTQRKYFDTGIIIKEMSIWAAAAVPSATTVTLKVNGTAVATAVILNGTSAATTGALSLIISPGDYLTIDLISTGALDVGLRINY